MGKEEKPKKPNKLAAGVVAVRNNVVKVVAAPGEMRRKSKEQKNERLDSIYETSSVVAVQYVDRLRSEFPEANTEELLAYMQSTVFDGAVNNPSPDFTVDNLTLYVCVALELSGGKDIDIMGRRKCMALIDNTRKINKTRKVLKQIETAARIGAAIAALLPDKGKLAPIKKVGMDFSNAMAAKDVMQMQLVNAFENNGVKNPGLQMTAKKVIADAHTILDAAKALPPSEHGEL